MEKKKKKKMKQNGKEKGKEKLHVLYTIYCFQVSILEVTFYVPLLFFTSIFFSNLKHFFFDCIS